MNYKIKHIDSDFIEKEIVALSPQINSKAPYAYFEITLRGLSTFHFKKTLSHKTGIPMNDIAFSSSKGDSEIANQLFCVPRQYEGEILNKLKDLPGINQICRKGYHSIQLSPGYLIGNLYHVIIRNLNCEIADYMKKESIGRDENLTFLNFYNPNKFGTTADPTIYCEIGEMLIGGEIAKAYELIIKTGAVSEVLHYNDSNLSDYADLINIIDRDQLNFYLSMLYSKKWNTHLAKVITYYTNEFYDIDDIKYMDSDVISKKVPQRIGYKKYRINEDNEIITEIKDRKTFTSTKLFVNNICEDSFNKLNYLLEISFSLPRGSYAVIAIKQWISKICLA